MVVAPANDAYKIFRNGSSFYFRLYLDGEWCDLWSRDASFIDNGTHITLMLKPPPQCEHYCADDTRNCSNQRE